jgi:hypothetical protein
VKIKPSTLTYLSFHSLIHPTQIIFIMTPPLSCDTNLAFLFFTSFEKPRLHERTKAIRGCSMNSAIECALKRVLIITSSLLQNLYTYMLLCMYASVIMLWSKPKPWKFVIIRSIKNVSYALTYVSTNVKCVIYRPRLFEIFSHKNLFFC